MRQPGFIEMERVDFAIEHGLDRFDVIDDAVVSQLRDRQDTRFFVDGIAGERVGLDFFPDVFRFEFRFRDRPDDAVMVACRHQENRNRSGHDDGVQNRFVAIAVDNDDVAAGDAGMPNDLVGSRCTVGDEIAVVRVENAGGIAFALDRKSTRLNSSHSGQSRMPSSA